MDLARDLAFRGVGRHLARRRSCRSRLVVLPSCAAPPLVLRRRGRGGCLAVGEEQLAARDGGHLGVRGAVPLGALGLLVQAADARRALAAVRAQVALRVRLGLLVHEHAVLAHLAAAALAVALLLVLALLLLARAPPPLAARDVRRARRDPRQRAGRVAGGGARVARHLRQPARVLGPAVVDILVDGAAAEVRAGRRAGQERAVGAPAPQHRRLVLLPVVLLEVEAAVLGPEEEPDARDHEGHADEPEQDEDEGVVDVVGVRHADGRVQGALALVFVVVVPCEKDSAGGERSQLFEAV